MKEEEMRSVWIFAVGLLVGAGLVWAPAANAGELAQVTCTQPGGQPAPIEGWEEGWTGGPFSDAGDNNECASGGSLASYVGDNVPQPGSSGPYWQYAPPAGDKIVGGQVSGSFSVAPGANNYSGAAGLLGPKFLFDNADVIGGDAGGIAGTFDGTYSLANHTGGDLWIYAFCEPPGATCPAAGSSQWYWAVAFVNSAIIELQNSATPTGTGFGGTLLEPGASGTADLTFSAQDPGGPGVYRVNVALDGSVVYHETPEANGGSCASIGKDSSGVAEFLHAQPCKQNVAVDIPLDTTRFAGGAHSLKVTVEDAAGNSAVVLARSVTFASHIAGSGSTPIGPGSPAVLRGAANGANASDQATLTARWSHTSKAAFTSRYGVRERVTGHLTTSAGAPVSAASIDVYETPAYHGAAQRRIGGISTGPTGQWILTLPRNISSCVLRFVYRSHVNDTVAAASATLKLSVRAGIALTVTPRSASVGRKIFFSGVLGGAPVPEDGKQLVLEARAGREWIQFDTIHTNAKGRYRASYRFKFPGPVTYRFRVVSPHEADFPFLEGASNIVTVHER